MTKRYNIRKGDLLIVAELTGLSHSMVKKVSSGTHSNLSIEKALTAITKKRNQADNEIVEKLKKIA